MNTKTIETAAKTIAKIAINITIVRIKNASLNFNV